MVTRNQALREDRFHFGLCTRVVGPRGGVQTHIVECRRNGNTQTWKTRPDEFRIPIKHGLRNYGEITHNNCMSFHIVSECPLLTPSSDKQNA